MTITSQPNNNGYYSCYLPIKFEITDTSDYLYFEIETSAGGATGIPVYKAPNIDNVFYFDASELLISYFNVRNEKGFKRTTIVALNDIFEHLRVTISNGTSTIISDTFYAFTFLDNKKYYGNNQTAYQQIINHYWLNSTGNSYYSINGIYQYEYLSDWTSLNFFLRSSVNQYSIQTYSDSNFTNILQTITYVFAGSFNNKIICFPINKQHMANIGLTNTNWKSIKITSIVGGLYVARFKEIDIIPHCEKQTFIFINRFGVKEDITIYSKKNKALKTSSDFFKSAGYDHLPNPDYIRYQYDDIKFNTSPFEEKINQTSENIITVDSENYNNPVKVYDFLNSPMHWKLSDIVTLGLQNLERVVLSDGDYELTKNGRMAKISFKYQFSNKRKAFK